MMIVLYVQRISHETGWQKKSRFGKKSSESPVSYANRVHFFILLCHSFSWNCRKKMAVLWQVFVSKVEFWAVSWNRDIGIKCWNCQFGRKKLKLTAAAKPRAVSFIFFPDRIWRFHNFMPLLTHESTASFIFDAKKIWKKVVIFSPVIRETVPQ